MVDATRRKLKVPHRFVPYMETHHVYELFHDLASELVKKRPIDHILYLKEALAFLGSSRDTPRIIIIAPPQIDKSLLCLKIAEKTGVTLVNSEVINETQRHGTDLNERTLAFAEKAGKFLQRKEIVSTGWILTDFPTTPEEALNLQVEGVLPTHTFQLILNDSKDPSVPIDPIETCTKEVPVEELIMTMKIAVYQRNLLGYREAFKSTLKEVEVNGRDMDDLAIKCVNFLAQGKQYKPLMLPRICLLGMRGSGKRTQARMLCKRFNLVHVDLNVLLAQVRQQHNDTAERLKLFEVNSVEIKTDFLNAVIENRILGYDCLSQGWVMTGYPRNSADLKSFTEQSSTPPNRIIFINTPYGECTRRLKGSQTTPQVNNELLLKDLRTSALSLAGMKTYIGAKGIQVDGSRSVHQLFELVSGTIVCPAPKRISEFGRKEESSSKTQESNECLTEIPDAEDPMLETV